MAAVAGTSSTGTCSGESTSTLVNMPGRSRPSSLGTVARTFTLRVATSTSVLMVLTFPFQVAPGKVSVWRWTGWPTLSRGQRLLRAARTPT